MRSPGSALDLLVVEVRNVDEHLSKAPVSSPTRIISTVTIGERIACSPADSHKAATFLARPSRCRHPWSAILRTVRNADALACDLQRAHQRDSAALTSVAQVRQKRDTAYRCQTLPPGASTS